MARHKATMRRSDRRQRYHWFNVLLLRDRATKMTERSASGGFRESTYLASRHRPGCTFEPRGCTSRGRGGRSGSGNGSRNIHCQQSKKAVTAPIAPAPDVRYTRSLAHAANVPAVDGSQRLQYFLRLALQTSLWCIHVGLQTRAYRVVKQAPIPKRQGQSLPDEELRNFGQGAKVPEGWGTTEYRCEQKQPPPYIANLFYS